MKTRNVRAVFSIAIAALFVTALVVPPHASATVPGVNSIASVDSSGTQGNGGSGTSGISGDGRYVVFNSAATNLVTGDTNGANDVFVKDTQTGTTTVVSVSTSGTEGNAFSGGGRISYDGRYVVFDSAATNLVSGDTNGFEDVFIHDMQTGTTTRVDTSAGGTQANNVSADPDVSADGRYVVFASGASTLVSGFNPTGFGTDIFLKDMHTGAIEALSEDGSGNPGNHGSDGPRIDCSGNVVTFWSQASNLVSGDTNGDNDVFVDDLGWSGNELNGITLAGNQDSVLPSVSCNGNDIVYQSGATNLVAGDTNGDRDIFNYNRLTQTTSLVSLNSSGTQTNSDATNATVSDDGHYVTFESAATNLDSYTSDGISGGNVFIRDTKANTTQLITFTVTGLRGDTGANAQLSPDGSYVTYDYTEQCFSGNCNRALLTSDNNSFGDAYLSETGF